MMRPPNQPLLEIEELVVHFTTRSGIVQGARGVNLQVDCGETLGLVGESGSGKSVTFQAVMGLSPPPAKSFPAMFAGRAAHCSLRPADNF